MANTFKLTWYDENPNEAEKNEAFEKFEIERELERKKMIEVLKNYKWEQLDLEELEEIINHLIV